MIELAIWAAVGTAVGLVFGIIPGLGPFIAIATLYPILMIASSIDVMMCYIALLIATNYSNAVTAIIYGLPGDATAIMTARIGHRFFLKGHGSLAVSTAAICSTMGVLFSIALFVAAFPIIITFFNFYNSVFQTLIVFLSLLLIVFLTKQNKVVTLGLFLFGMFISRIGIDPVTFESFATFGNSYLSLGIPFGAVMVGLYILPEILKLRSVDIGKPGEIKDRRIGNGIWMPAFIGSFIGFWCGLIPGVTNILGSYLSATVVKRFYKLSNLKSLAAAEAANNSGALGSLLPLLILAIPITGSEILVYYLMMEKGYRFNAENTSGVLFDIVYLLPIVTALCLFVSWHGFNLLGKVAYLYKKHMVWFNPFLLIAVSTVNVLIFPIHSWMVVCIMVLSVIGYMLRRYDTSSVIYGYFLGELLLQNLSRTLIILS